MKATIAVLVAITLTGCGGLGGLLAPNPTSTATQVTKDNPDAAAVCVTLTGFGGQGKAVVVRSDKGVAKDTKVDIEGDCKTSIATGAGVTK